jgi:hypothetical protein
VAPEQLAGRRFQAIGEPEQLERRQLDDVLVGAALPALPAVEIPNDGRQDTSVTGTICLTK